MRALMLTMTAFGPYNEQQVIDFRQLGEESIFLVTGPTGAGKTTIFDAICFCLYGKASGSEREHDTFRSDFASSDQLTAVSFLFQLKGKTYLVKRQPKQMRPKERGEGLREEPAQAEFYQVEEEEEKILHTKIKDVNETIEQLLGLDYDQFRKMIMIPQGEFRKLIAENSKDREEILQKIFRTYFYRDITDTLKAEAKEKKEALEQIEWKLTQEIEKLDGHEEGLSDHSTKEVMDELTERIEINQKLKLSIEEEKKKREEVRKERQAHFFQGKQLAELFDEQSQLFIEKTKLEQKNAEITDKRTIVSLAEKAEQIVPIEKQLKNRKKEWEMQQQRLSSLENKRQQLQKQSESIAAQYQAFQQNEQKMEQKRQDIQTKMSQLTKWIQYEKIADELKQVKEAKEEARTKQKQLEQKKQDNQDQLKALEKQLEDHLTITNQYFQAKEALSQAVTKTEQFERLSSAFTKLTQLRSEYKKVEEKYQAQKQALTKQQKKLEEIETEKRNQHALLLAAHLEEGAPCPVCGSEEHPKLAKSENEAAANQSNEQVQEEINKLTKALELCQDQLIDAKSNGQGQRQLVEELVQPFDTTFDKLNDQELLILGQTCQKNQQAKQQELQRLEKQVGEMDQKQKQKQTLAKQVENVQVELEKNAKRNEEIHTKYIKLAGKLEQLKEEIPTVKKTRQAWQAEMEVQKTEVEQWFTDWKRLKHQIDEHNLAIADVKSSVKSHQAFLSETKQAWNKEHDAFTAALKEYGFESEKAYQEAKEKREHIEQFQQEIKEYEQRLDRVKDRLATLSVQLKENQKPDLDLLEKAANEANEKCEETMQQLHQVEQELTNQKRILQNLTLLSDKHNDIAKAYYDIAELANLARGDNHLRLSFERYVLSSFLDEILLQANLRMDQLTEHRYQLIRSDQIAKRGAQSGLDLEVMDQHTGKRRSVRTLSGGEGFKAALSLALGMADVVQAHAGGVQLETLFIDEGFGTLDELSLEQAIDCLKGLQQSNRILGIISHVPQLKEEIHAKLVITPSPRGSTVTFHL
ncbi:exonuclease SbcC [Natronobacillus azotifigens]|uniref:Nuclease SbcCD subunit C n=1 Tax=Natronobacillus azotifigens TaxID=472978 RepID=A0A9J6R8F4_9BACI|nr:SMC family ATPase [Natronobacillus azotifigens]MCZ0701909.1 SMC family ATPase [Natronobacillus azotifigens]